MTRYLCNNEIEIDAESAEAAAKEYAETGEWGERERTQWVTVWCVPLDDDGEPDEDEGESNKAEIPPYEPDCTHEGGHDWQSPIELVGGVRENPGVSSSGGGVLIEEVCMRCGTHCYTDTWAQDPYDGEQGLCSVRYEPYVHSDAVEELRRQEDE